MRKKVLVLSTCYPLSDLDISAIFLKSLYQAIVETKKVEITILAADHSESNFDYDNKLRQQGLQVKRYQYFFHRWQTLLYGDAALSNLKRNPFIILLLLPLFLSLFFRGFTESVSGKYSLIHAHWSLPTGLIAVVLGKLFHIPVMVTSHGGDIYGLQGKISRTLQKWVFSEADLVNAVSFPVMQEIKSLAPRSHVMVKSMGVNESVFHPISDAREQLGLTKGHKILLFVGRFSEKKGVEYLLEAVSILQSRIDSLQLLLIGTGNLENKVKKVVAEKRLGGIITLLGLVENQKLPTYYSAADLLVIPSVAAVGGQEGLPVTIMEGLLCGKKVVTTEVGGIVELSELKSIFFSRPKDSEDLAESIYSALQDESLKTSQTREEGMRFSINRVAGDFIRYYEELFD